MPLGSTGAVGTASTVLGVDGKRYPAGGFVGTGAKEMDCNLNSSVLRDRASGFEVRDADGPGGGHLGVRLITGR